MAYFNKRGSIFLITLTLLTAVFILGFALTFFTGSEDYSSSMSYETEVAFNLAEAATEEFVARLKNALNDPSENNQLFKVLRSDNVDVSKPITLDAQQVANLTAFTRDLARQNYGIQFSRGLSDSSDFVVDAVIKLNYINSVEAANGDNVLYSIRQDKMEKQGEIQVTSKVNYKGHEAKIVLTFLIRCVKTFVPPFNYFTLFIRDASVPGGSFFDVCQYHYDGKVSSSPLRLDNGWRVIKNKDWNPVSKGGSAEWERSLGEIGNDAPTPPGRVYLGQDLETLYGEVGPMVHIRSGNGVKMLFGDALDANSNIETQMNARDNAFLRLDVPWTGLSDYVKNWVVYQGQVEKEKDAKNTKWYDPRTWFGTGWKDDVELRVLNVGAGEMILKEEDPFSFKNSFMTFDKYTQNKRKEESVDEDTSLMFSRIYTDLDLGGFEPFGTSVPVNRSHPTGQADFSKISPTIVYGPAMRQYFRSIQFRDKKDKNNKNAWFEFPFVSDENYKMFSIPWNQDEKHAMTATEAAFLFLNSGVEQAHVDKIANNWEKLPKDLRTWKKYSKFMSNSGAELFNRGLINMLTRINFNGSKVEEYTESSPLFKYSEGYMENAQYPNMPSSIQTAIINSPMREYYEGLLAYALPDRYSTYLMDFYFIPRSTEDFFRGRTTIPIGGIAYDRFDYKYINDVQSYKGGANFQTLELNGILALNDSEPLGLLHNLLFKGHGVIYSSPMMGGGKVVIDGNLLAVDTFANTNDGKEEELEAYFPTSVGENLLTIIAPQIVIKTNNAPGDRCFVEANLISLSEGIIATGTKPVTIKGSVVTPYLDCARYMPSIEEIQGGKYIPESKRENVIIYNPINGLWRDKKYRSLLNKLYVAKIVTGGVGKFDWKYEK
jgi:hypothetical protein